MYVFYFYKYNINYNIIFIWIISPETYYHVIRFHHKLNLKIKSILRVDYGSIELYKRYKKQK